MIKHHLFYIFESLINDVKEIYIIYINDSESGDANNLHHFINN